MSPQADFVVSNGTGAAVRSDINGQLAAIVSNSSGTTEPATMYAYQWWADTTTGLLKLRNGANNAWITVGTLASANLGLLPLAGGTMTGVLAVTAGTAALPGIAVSGDPNTGIYSPGADQVAISTGGTGRLFVGTTGNIGIGTSSPGTARTYIQSNDTNTAGLTVSGINSSGGVSGFSTLKLIGNTPNATTLHYGAEFIKSQSNVEGITGYYADVTGSYNTQTNFHAKLTKNLGASTNGYCYYADLSTSSSGGLAYFHYCYNSTSAALRFSVQDSGQVVIDSAASTPPFIAKINGTEHTRVASTGELLVGKTTVTTNGGKLQVSNGITFPATQVDCSDANTLDDYEEGTWTPAISGTSSAGTGTYSVQVGRYTKVGNKVTVHLNLTWSAHTGTGNMTISGLPFTSANVTNLNPTTVAYANNLTITGIPVVLVTANATTGTINSVSNGTAAALAMDTAATFTATITYQAA
jgi:hypothetical protein